MTTSFVRLFALVGLYLRGPADIIQRPGFARVKGYPPIELLSQRNEECISTFGPHAN